MPARVATEDSPGPSQPTLIRTIVIGYSRGELPTPWLVTFHRFEHAMSRAGVNIRVRLDPLEEWPEEGAEMLIVPPDLVETAKKLNTGAIIIAATSGDAVNTINRLLEQLTAGTEIRAEPIDPDAPHIIRYKGLLPL